MVLIGHHLVSNFALRDWGEDNERTGRNDRPAEYLMWYGIWILLATVSSFASGVLLWVFCAITSAKHLHDSVSWSPSLSTTLRHSVRALQMLHAVLKAPLGWFERTPMVSYHLFLLHQL
jgi:ATP-binding cassette subfamily C (CFTR/MRP) protein 1